MKQNGKIALGGMITALCTVLMFLTGLFPFATYALPAIAGAIIVCIVIDLGKKWAFLVYGAVSLLSVLVAPDKEAAVMFIAFFGYYPILKAALEQLRSRVLGYALKLLVFNVTVVTAFLFVLKVLSVPGDVFEIFGKYTPAALLVIANFTFVIYDIGLTNAISMYVARLHPKLKKIFK